MEEVATDDGASGNSRRTSVGASERQVPFVSLCDRTRRSLARSLAPLSRFAVCPACIRTYIREVLSSHVLSSFALSLRSWLSSYFRFRFQCRSIVQHRKGSKRRAPIFAKKKKKRKKPPDGPKSRRDLSVFRPSVIYSVAGN